LSNTCPQAYATRSTVALHGQVSNKPKHRTNLNISSHTEPAFEVSSFGLGAADFIAKPVNAPLVLARVQTQLRLKRLADELRRIASIDALTGVANRRLFDQALEREWRRARRGGDAICLLMIDIDHFKACNDHYGHPAGDACLRAVAQALAPASTRPADLVARYGGEEFAVLLPQTPRGGARHVAHALLDAVESLGIEHQGSAPARQVTISIGVGCYDEHSSCWTPVPAESRLSDPPEGHSSGGELLRAADAALYAAKRGGRAMARLLDIAHVDLPHLARDIGPSRHARRGSAREPRPAA
jgi:diguanylate cyclase (GGDEF)-like protein